VINKVFPPDPLSILLAAKKLRSGNLVGFPTETVYGLGADIEFDRAIQRVFEVKGRPKNHPLIIHLSRVEIAREVAVFNSELVQEIIANFCPGPLTLVLPKRKWVSTLTTGGRETVAIRFPKHKVAQSLLENFHANGGIGVAAPSANKFGKTSPTNSMDVLEDIGNDLSSEDMILDGGSSDVGVESTILDLSSSTPVIRRLGSITDSMLKDFLGKIEIDIHSKNNSLPGSHESHYSPIARVLTNTNNQVGGGFLALSTVPTPAGLVRLGSPTSVEEFAFSLYSTFRLADKRRLEFIVVICPDGNGLSAAIRDRVQRAASNFA
jgi:L-threonylcarbamoyladenylate synthase